MQIQSVSQVLRRTDNPFLLSDQWDSIAESYFQKREFLCHLHELNPCGQRYYQLYETDVLIAGCCVYTLEINLFTFFRGNLSFKMQVIGIAVSVACPGIIGPFRAREKLLTQIVGEESGLILGLNLERNESPVGAIEMEMLPSVVFSHSLKNWEDYRQSLKSRYRRRLKLILRSFKNIEKRVTDCSAFTPDHHKLYLKVLKRSSTKLESLNNSFFAGLPSNFQLTSYYLKSRLLSWHINLYDGPIAYFFLGGHDYKYCVKYSLYFNNLYSVLQQAIKRGSKKIDFGQTAEIAKLRLGGKIDEKKLFLYHSNRFVRGILRIMKPWIQYKAPSETPHVFNPYMKAYKEAQFKVLEPHENTLYQTETV